jgi:hypothetical protein
MGYLKAWPFLSHYHLPPLSEQNASQQQEVEYVQEVAIAFPFSQRRDPLYA